MTIVPIYGVFFFAHQMTIVYWNTTYIMLFKNCLRLTEEMMYKYETYI